MANSAPVCNFQRSPLKEHYDKMVPNEVIEELSAHANPPTAPGHKGPSTAPPNLKAPATSPTIGLYSVGVEEEGEVSQHAATLKEHNSQCLHNAHHMVSHN